LDDQQAYLLEFTDLKMRIYKDEGVIVEANKTISGATQADPCVITATAHGYSDGDEVFIDSVVGMTELNGKFFLVANKTANTFELTDVDGTGIDATGFTAYSSAGTVARIVEVTTVYPEAVLFELKVAQNADTMYIVHRSHDPYKLTRTSHVAWTLVTFSRTSICWIIQGSGLVWTIKTDLSRSQLSWYLTGNGPVKNGGGLSIKSPESLNITGSKP